MTLLMLPSLFFFGLIILGNAFQLMIIHNNDMHSKFEQTTANYETCSEEEAAEGKCYGGFARTKTAIDRALEDAKGLNIPSIVVNPGDFYVGSPHYELKKWEVVIPMVNALNFHLIAPGNHEFDDGIDGLINFINRVNAPVLCCNLDLESEPRLKNVPNLKPSIVLDIEGTKIGVIGSLTPYTMAFELTENLKILPEIPSIQVEARKLKKDGVKIIILLSHSGFDYDPLIAPEIPELSLIVGSHSHTLLHNPTDSPPSTEKVEAPYPYFVELSDKVIPIVQAGGYTKYLGKLIVSFDDDGNVIREATYGNTMLLDASIPEDPEMKKFVEKLIAPIRAQLKSPIAYTRVPLKPVDFSKREFESTLANLVTDALLDFAVLRTVPADSKKWTSISIALINISSNFHDLGKQGQVSLEDILNTFKSSGSITEATYAGSVIKEALEWSLIPEENKFQFPSFLHIAGLRVIYDLSKPINERVESIKVLCTNSITPQYENLKMDQDYRVILGRNLLSRRRGFKMLRNEAKDVFNIIGTGVRKVVRAYLERKKIIYPAWDGRVVVNNIESLALNKDT